MFALASANAGFVQYAGLPYAASPLLTRAAVPAISQFSHLDYHAIPATVPLTYSAQYAPAAVHLATPYAAYPTAHHIATPYASPWAYSAPGFYAAAPALALAKKD
jgi:hypothetical protein